MTLHPNIHTITSAGVIYLHGITQRIFHRDFFGAIWQVLNAPFAKIKEISFRFPQEHNLTLHNIYL